MWRHVNVVARRKRREKEGDSTSRRCNVGVSATQHGAAPTPQYSSRVRCANPNLNSNVEVRKEASPEHNDGVSPCATLPASAASLGERTPAAEAGGEEEVKERCVHGSSAKCFASHPERRHWTFPPRFSREPPHQRKTKKQKR